MNLKEFQKQYPDAVKAVLTMTSEAMKTHNFYKTDELREYLQTIFSGSSILYCNCSGRKVTAITSEEAYEEEKRQLSMIPGIKVIMTGSEGDFPENKNKEWKVYAGPKWMCGSLVVWLEGFSGAYSCEHLKIVEYERETKPLEALEKELLQIWYNTPTNKIELRISDHITLISLDYDEKEESTDQDFIEKVYCTFNCMGTEIDLDFEKKVQIDDFTVCYDKLSTSEAYLHFESNIPNNKDLIRMIWRVIEKCI